MYISLVTIRNFRSLRDITIPLRETNILIGPNNSGKTSFLQALNYAIGWKSGTPQEDDFYVADPKKFDPKMADPIEIILDFQEGYKPLERFSETINILFDGIIQFDVSLVKPQDEPIKFIRLKYQYSFVKEKGKYIESRVFLNFNNEPIAAKNTGVNKERLSFFPFYYLEELRDIKKEINNRGSYWGKMKESIDYSAKEEKINKLVSALDNLLVKNEPRLNNFVVRLQEIQKSVKISDQKDSIFLKAFSNRSWELLDGLNLYLKTANSNIALPVEKHGMGTQNIAILIIFNAYLDILLPELIENLETTPIIGIEEPEAHVYPHSQRALFDQLIQMNGQKIISTHSPYIVDQANIYDYVLFRNVGGETQVRRIPEYKSPLKYGLPDIAYEKNAYFEADDIHTLQRYIKFKNTELLFSFVFLMCEGESEKIFLNMIAPTYLGKTLGRCGVSLISCDGLAYAHFLKIASKDALHIPWVIFSDGEARTKDIVRTAVLKNGYTEDDINEKIVFLPDGKDFEGYYIDWLGETVLLNIISEKYGPRAMEKHISDLEKKLNKKIKGKVEDKCTECGFPVNQNKGSSDEKLIGKMLINHFIDEKGKTIFAEYIAEHVLLNELKLPKEIKGILSKIKNI